MKKLFQSKHPNPKIETIIAKENLFLAVELGELNYISTSNGVKFLVDGDYDRKFVHTLKLTYNRSDEEKLISNVKGMAENMYYCFVF